MIDFLNMINLKKSKYHIDSNMSFSQEGEDMILREIFQGKDIGFYVDIGAFHPTRFSNTNYFYQIGWSGINIEPSPISLNLFQKHRPRDINLNLGISDLKSDLTYFSFDEQALNTFDEDRKKKLELETSYKCIKYEKVNVDRLDIILNNYSPSNTIDFMNIDVECHEMKVLRSNNWEKFRPRILLVEILDFKLEEIINNPIHNFLKEIGYRFECKTPRTCFYKDIEAG